jgi:hypothetical protein
MFKTTFDTRPLLAMMLHTGTKSTMFRNSKMSYRPMSCFTLSQEVDKNEGSYLKQEKNQTQLPYRPTRQSPPPTKDTQVDESDKKIALYQQTLYQ